MGMILRNGLIGKRAFTYGPLSRPYELMHVSTCVALTAGLMSGKVSFAL
jgi:hypothetical protein